MLASFDRTINDIVCMNVENNKFMIRISEDVAEIIDFGPRYELDDVKSEVSAEEGSGCGGDLLENGSVDETPIITPRKTNSHRQRSLKQLELVKSLIITSAFADNDDLEDAEFIVDQKIENIVGSPLTGSNAIPTMDNSDPAVGPNICLESGPLDLDYCKPVETHEPTCQLVVDPAGLAEEIAAFTIGVYSDPPIVVPSQSKLSGRNLSKSSSSQARKSAFVGKLLLRKVKKMASWDMRAATEELSTDEISAFTKARSVYF